MCDCFPATGGGISLPPQCQHKTGNSDYGDNFKQWCNPVVSKSFFNPPTQSEDVWRSRYSFSKGPRFGISPCCDCTPAVERSRFESVYTRDFNDCVFNDPSTRRHRVVDGVQPQFGTCLPKQFLCPFTTETTYARSFDMPQKHFAQICTQQEPCGGCNDPPCDDENQCASPCGIEIRYSSRKKDRPKQRLLKENLIKPGTDTSDCCKCPKGVPCCPCPEDANLCDACCGCEYPCKIHQAATMPTRKYPITWNTPRYIPDPNVPPRRPKLCCAGGTLECPVQSQFPTLEAIKQAKYRLMEKLERERCQYPPESLESLYRSTYKTPPLSDAPKYASIAHQIRARDAQAEFAEKGFPPKCMPAYCLDGGRPADPRPAFDHFSTYEADFAWKEKKRFNLLGGENPCTFEIKPLCHPCVRDARKLIKKRTEEKERWGEDWECCPPPAEQAQR